MTPPAPTVCPDTIVGKRLIDVRLAGAEVVLTFSGELHLICRPEVMLDADSKAVQVTGMKWEVATGPATILGKVLHLGGPACRVLLEDVTHAGLDPIAGTFVIQFGPYTLTVSKEGLMIFETKRLTVDWRESLVTAS